MTAIALLDLTIFDAPDIKATGAFYADLTGWEVIRDSAERFGIRTPDGQEIEFQHAPDHVAPRWPGQEVPQHFHLDLQVTGREEAAERAVRLGATRLAAGPTWVTLADPAGHPFDLCEAEGVSGPMKLFAVTIDAPDASALAHFYGDLTGMEVTYEGPEGALLVGDGKTLMFQQVGDYTAPGWPDPARPQQAHLDLLVRDPDAAQARAVELGATRLDEGGERYRVFTDPAGHPFCLVG